MSAWLENIGVLPACSVSCSLSTTDTLVTLIDDYAGFGDLGSGEIVEGDAPFVFTISGSVGDGDVVFFVLTASDTSSNSWTFDLDFTVRAPDINFQSLSRVTRLSQNYPNPFNPMTTIPFDLSKDGGAGQDVKLFIFDIRGRLVRKLIDTVLEPGSHRAVWSLIFIMSREISFH